MMRHIRIASHNHDESPSSSSSPAIAADGTLFIGSEDGHLYALRDGEGAGDYDYDGAGAPFAG